MNEHVGHRRAWRASRERAIAAAVEVIAERGVERTRFLDVAAAGGLSVGNLQYLFGSRAGLIRTALETASNADLAVLEHLVDAGQLPDALERSLADATSGLGRGVVVRTELWHAALRDDQLAPLATAVADTWRRLLDGHLATADIEQALVLAGVAAPAGATRQRAPNPP